MIAKEERAKERLIDSLKKTLELDIDDYSQYIEKCEHEGLDGIAEQIKLIKRDLIVVHAFTEMYLKVGFDD